MHFTVKVFGLSVRAKRLEYYDYVLFNFISDAQECFQFFHSLFY